MTTEPLQLHYECNNVTKWMTNGRAEFWSSGPISMCPLVSLIIFNYIFNYMIGTPNNYIIQCAYTFRPTVWSSWVHRAKETKYYLLTYLLHRAESFLRSQLVLQLIKKYPAFYGTRKFITVLKSARQKLQLQTSFLVRTRSQSGTNS